MTEAPAKYEVKKLWKFTFPTRSARQPFMYVRIRNTLKLARKEFEKRFPNKKYIVVEITEEEQRDLLLHDLEATA